MRREIAGKLLRFGYGLLSGCGAFQWGITLWTGRTEGVSGTFLGLFVVGLAVLTVAFWLNREHRWIQIGNAVGLLNALAMLAAWWWVR